MGIKSWLSKPLASWVVKKQNKWSAAPIETQQRVFKEILRRAAHTQFGKDHDFQKIQTHAAYAAQVPIREYEGFTSYIEAIKNGTKDVLWPGLPIYFAKTSGTTSGVIYSHNQRFHTSSHQRRQRRSVELHTCNRQV